MQGILFKPWKSKAIRDNPDTLWQTRRLITPQPQWISDAWYWKHPRYNNGDGVHYFHSQVVTDSVKEAMIPCARYKIGEVVYIKEPYALNFKGQILLKSEYETLNKILELPPVNVKWENSMFMKEEYARTFVKILGIIPQQLQDMTQEDAVAEGIERHTDRGNNIFWFEIAGDYHGDTQSVTAREAFAKLWDSINHKRGDWESNPWVFGYTVQVLEIKGGE